MSVYVNKSNNICEVYNILTCKRTFYEIILQYFGIVYNTKIWLQVHKRIIKEWEWQLHAEQVQYSLFWLYLISHKKITEKNWMVFGKILQLFHRKKNYRIYSVERTQSVEKHASQKHRCEHQIASISRKWELRPPTPTGIHWDCFSCKKKTNMQTHRKKQQPTHGFSVVFFHSNILVQLF